MEAHPTTQGLLANEVTKPHPAYKEQRPCDLSLARPRAGARRAGTPWGGRDGRPGAEGCWSLPTAGRPQSEKPARQPPGWRPDSLALPAAAWPAQSRSALPRAASAPEAMTHGGVRDEPVAIAGAEPRAGHTKPCSLRWAPLSKGRAPGLSSGLLKVQSILTLAPSRGLRGPVRVPAQPWEQEGLSSDLQTGAPRKQLITD